VCDSWFIADSAVQALQVRELISQAAPVKRQRTDGDDQHQSAARPDDTAEGSKDPVQKFADLVDWGNVPKPAGW
jgi:hypothetical protein